MRARYLMCVAVVLCIAAAAAAQECTLQTITGTYAFRYTGESFLGGMPAAPDATPAPGTLPVHSAGLYAAGTVVGIMNVKPDGSVAIHYWSTLGSWSSMRAGVDMTGQVTQIGIEQDADGVPLGCAGVVAYQPFPPFPGNQDKFFVLENGREIHIIPMTGEPFSTFAMTGVARRLTRAGTSAPRCSQQNTAGSYVLDCPGPLFNPTGAVQTIGSAAVIHIRVAADGTMTGILHNRSANQFSSTALQGAMLANPDCTGEAWFVSEQFAPGAVVKAMFVYSDLGDNGFAMPLELFYPGANLTVPYSPVSCTMKKATP